LEKVHRRPIQKVGIAPVAHEEESREKEAEGKERAHRENRRRPRASPGPLLPAGAGEVQQVPQDAVHPEDGGVHLVRKLPHLGRVGGLRLEDLREAQADLIPRVKDGAGDPFAVDQGPVGAVQVLQYPSFGKKLHPAMLPGDQDIVDDHITMGRPADFDQGLCRCIIPLLAHGRGDAKTEGHEKIPWKKDGCIILPGFGKVKCVGFYCR
jgi:hypothetical protein